MGTLAVSHECALIRQHNVRLQDHDQRMNSAPANEPLAARFQSERTRLQALATRMLGSMAEAEDVVQDAWLRLHRGDSASIDNLGGWLTTVVTRLSLDRLRARKSHAEESLDDTNPRNVRTDGDDDGNPEHAAQLADALGPALLLVLDTLSPAERVAFVLHDMFALSFDDIAGMLERRPDAVRQLASRARRRVTGAHADAVADRQRSRAVVEAFLLASRTGDLDGLLAVLAPDVVMHADASAVSASRAHPSPSAPRMDPERIGRNAVVDAFLGRASQAQTAQVDGLPAAIWAPGGVPRVVIRIAVRDALIVGIDVIADQRQVAAMRIGEIGPLPTGDTYQQQRRPS